MITAETHAAHLTSMVDFEAKNGVSSNVLQNERHQQKQFAILEAEKGRSANLMSKSSKRKVKKVTRG